MIGSKDLIKKSYISKKKLNNANEYYKQLQSAKRVHNYLKDDTYEMKNNPIKYGLNQNDFK